MGYIERELQPEEKVVFRTHLHWGVFLPPAAVCLVALAIVALAPVVETGWGVIALRIGGLVVLVLALRQVLATLADYREAEFGLTDQRVLCRAGLGREQSAAMLLVALESVGVEQGFLGSRLGYGSLILKEVGGRSVRQFPYVIQPEEFRQRVEKEKAAPKADPQKWSITEHRDGAITVVELSGRLVFERSEELEKKLRSLIAAGQTKLVLACSQVKGIDSSGIGVVARAYVEAKKQGGSLKLAAPSQYVSQSLHYVRMAGIIEIFPDERTAVASFK